MNTLKHSMRSGKMRAKVTTLLVLVIVFSLLASSTAFGSLLGSEPSLNVDIGYAYGYWSNGRVDIGYNTYRQPGAPFTPPDPAYEPLKDLAGLHANGALIKAADDPSVYYTEEGTKRLIFSPSAFMSWGFDWNAIVTVPAGELAGYPNSLMGPMMFRPGSLVMLPRSPAIYTFGFDGAFHLIPDMPTFTALGLDLAAVMMVPEPEFALYTVSDPIASAAVPVDGSPVKAASSPAVYIWDTSGMGTLQLGLVISPMAFQSWNLDWNGILVMSDAEFASWLASASGTYSTWAKPGTLCVTASDPAVYVADYLAVQTMEPKATLGLEYASLKRCVTSMDVFNANGYLLTDVMMEDPAVISTVPRGTDIMGPGIAF